MEKFIARQPIFDQKKRVFGYELLFRSSLENYFHGVDVTHASFSVVVDALLVHGLERLTDKRKAFVNLSRELLVSDFAPLFPKDRMVLEILETVEPDAEVLEACRQLKESGYCVALDDVTSAERVRIFADYVNLVKVDLPTTSPNEIEEMVRLCKPRNITLLAEKVETHEEFRQAAEQGFNYFQGYFFSKPQVTTGRDIPAFKLNYLRILQAINRWEINREEIIQIIKTEASLSYKLLRYLNSAFFAFRSDIRSIQHAVSILGDRNIKRWASLVVTAAMGEDKPQELVVTSLVRATWCELLASKVGMLRQSADLFMLGLFSLFDAILDRPMPEVLSQLPVAEDIKTALLHRNNQFSEVLNLVESYEQADWSHLEQSAKSLALPEDQIPETYLKAMESAHQVFKSSYSR